MAGGLGGIVDFIMGKNVMEMEKQNENVQADTQEVKISEEIKETNEQTITSFSKAIDSILRGMFGLTTKTSESKQNNHPIDNNVRQACDKEAKGHQLSSFEEELMSINESMLPDVIAKRMSDLEEVNRKFENAREKQNEAQRKVDQAQEEAKKLVDKAATLGQLNPKVHTLFKLKWSSKNDRIKALEECVKELGEYGVDTAEFQQALVQVQTATMEASKAIMEVQAKQMEYSEHTADALKFLYGLNAYGIASTESIVTNLQLILSGAKKKDLGEMAKQQMYMVMSQLKSQENLKLRLDKNEDKIQYIVNELQFHSNKVEEIYGRINDGEERDRQQDEALEQQIQKDNEHDEAIRAIMEKDEEQDEVIKQLRERVEELEKQIENVKENMLDKKVGYITMGLTLASILLSILHFVI